MSCIGFHETRQTLITMGEEIRRPPPSKRQKRVDVNDRYSQRQQVYEPVLNDRMQNDEAEQMSPVTSRSDGNRPQASDVPPGRSNADPVNQGTQRRRPFVDQIDQILQVFQLNKTDLDDEFFTLQKDEYQEIQKLYAQFQLRFPQPHEIIWLCETGHSSSLRSESPYWASISAYVHSVGKKRVILGKFTVQDPVRRLVIPRSLNVSDNGQCNFDNLTANLIKQNYRPPTMFVPLSDVMVGVSSNVYGVVTAINKLPVKEPNKSRWHSLFCITDPSLQPDNDSTPLEFKLHTFFVFDTDFPELHVGDIVRVQNMKVESHQDRKDGRIFKPEDISVLCYWDYKLPVPRDTREPHQRTVRLLTHWCCLNEKFFNSSTPRPCYSSNYPFLGIHTLQEVSDGLVFSLYCQVMTPFMSGSFYGLAVRDGTVFTLEENTTSVSTASWKRLAESNTEALESQDRETYDIMDDLRRQKQYFLNKPFGYIALMLFTDDQRRELHYLGIQAGDCLMVHNVTAKFLDKKTFRDTSSKYPFQSPCVVLALSTPRVSDCVTRLQPSHHEAFKIERRLHKLPDVLEAMEQWRCREEENPVQGDLLDKLSDPNVQVNLLQNICIL